MSAIEGMEEIALVLAEVFGNKLAEIKQQAEKLAAQDLGAAKVWVENVAAHIADTPPPPDLYAMPPSVAQPNEPPKDDGSTAP